MRILRYLGLPVVLLLSTPDTLADTPNIHQSVADQHLIPAYRQLADRTRELHRTSAMCSEGASGMAQIRTAYAPAFLAWQGIQHLRFGPVLTLSRDFRYQIWPDKRGTVGKHLRKLLQNPDADRLAPDTFAGGSAAVQGFSALERLLFNTSTTPSLDNPAWRCQVIAAITANLQQMSAETLNEWTEGEHAHRKLFISAAQGNDYYMNGDELSAQLLNNLHAQLERLVDQKLARPMGADLQHARPKRAEAWRSRLSKQALKTNIRALSDLYQTGFAPRLQNPALDQRITGLFEEAQTTLNGIRLPLAEAVRNDTERAKLDQLNKQLRTLNGLIARELSKALNLPLGFNSLDGD